ncbi:MAG TPA: hypothetical protein VH189_13750 [Rhizomicrobium sp.]|jgi:hypothetical protein|nr:hypothetical protein [Rhizomicrobium sp.]
MVRKLSLKDLIERLDTPGWHLVSDKGDKSDTGTLKDVLETSHQRFRRNDAPGLVKQIETSVELDMIQIQQLWQHLGLPTV